MKAEGMFFAALNTWLGASSVVHGKPEVKKFMTAHGARLLSDHRSQGYTGAVLSSLDLVFCTLMGKPGVSAPIDLSRHIDGFLTDRSPFGLRIVEFDEEQHFSPFRYSTLEIVAGAVDVAYDISVYRKYCMSDEHFRRFTSKCRITGYAGGPTTNALEFVQQLTRIPATARSGYIAEKKSFHFVGGRGAQRAYYDCLRDFFHRSPAGIAMKLRPIIRVPLFQVEELIGCDLGKSTLPAIAEAVASIVCTLASET